MDFVKPPTHGLLKDTQYQNNDNCDVRPSENYCQVIITEPIFTNLVNGQINAKTIGHGYIIKNRIAFSQKVTPEIYRKIITNFIHN